MPDRAYTDADIDAAVAAITDPGRLQDAQDLVMRVAPSLQAVLAGALEGMRDRISAAILNSGQPWPADSIKVNLLPASLPKHGTGLDLAVAVAVLTAAAAVPAEAAAKCALSPSLAWTAACAQSAASRPP